MGKHNASTPPSPLLSKAKDHTGASDTTSIQCHRRSPRHARAASFSSSPTGFNVEPKEMYEGDTEDQLSFRSPTLRKGRRPRRRRSVSVDQSPLDFTQEDFIQEQQQQQQQQNDLDCDGEMPSLSRCSRKTWSFSDLQAAVEKDKKEDNSKAWSFSSIVLKQGRADELPLADLLSRGDGEQEEEGHSSGDLLEGGEVKKRWGWMLACNDDIASPQALRYMLAARNRRSSEIVTREKLTDFDKSNTTRSLPECTARPSVDREVTRAGSSMREEELQTGPGHSRGCSLGEACSVLPAVTNDGSGGENRTLALEVSSVEDDEETNAVDDSQAEAGLTAPAKDEWPAQPSPRLGCNNNPLLKFAIVNSFRWKSGLDI